MSGSLVRGEGCSAPLGLQSGLIPDSALTSSLAASSPEHARLHHPASAWCFLYSEVKSRGRGDVLLEIDLGQPRLVSGFQSQGPPEALHPPDYMRYISLGLEVSTEAGQWADCCSGDTGGRTTFYADDKSGEAGVVRTHAFPALVAARRLRVRISTALRWIGHDHKCFRFEVLGCSAASEANSSLAAAALAPGYISVWWRQPRLGTQQLHSAFFLLNVTEVGGAGGGAGGGGPGAGQRGEQLLLPRPHGALLPAQHQHGHPGQQPLLLHRVHCAAPVSLMYLLIHIMNVVINSALSWSLWCTARWAGG